MSDYPESCCARQIAAIRAAAALQQPSVPTPLTPKNYTGDALNVPPYRRKRMVFVRNLLGRIKYTDVVDDGDPWR